MEKVFENSSAADIEAKLHYDTFEHTKNVKISLIIGFFVLMFLFRGFISYWLKFGVAIPTGFSMTPINTAEEPVQKNYTPKESAEKAFVYKSLINGHKIKIIPVAHYELSGLIVANNHDFLFVSDFFDSAALYDLGAAWGKLGKKNIYRKYFKCYSSKNEVSGSRVLWTEWHGAIPFTKEYASSHWSHSHIVPANNNVMAALLKLKRWQDVKIEGELVDMEYRYPNGIVQNSYTSMSRNDGGWSGDRGNGSCEVVYVTKVQIGNFIYE